MIKALQRCFVVVCAIAVAAVAAECVFRAGVWGRHTLSGMPPAAEARRINHPVFHHRYRSNVRVVDQGPEWSVTYTTNALGLRGTHEYGVKRAGMRRLLMLGDSFTFGNGVEDDEVFSALTQRWLDATYGNIEVINAGNSSHSPILHYLMLREVYLSLDPDAVILWFDFADLQDDFKYHQSAIYDREGRLVACNADYAHGRFSIMRYLAQRSSIVTYLYTKFAMTHRKVQWLGWRGYLHAKWHGEDVKQLATYATGRERAHGEILAYDRFLMIRGQASDAEIERYWQLTGGLILRIRDLLHERHIPLVLALYPVGVQVGPEQWGRGRVAYLFEPGVTYDDARPFDFIESFARAHGIPVINTYASFRAARDQRLFYSWDGHFTRTGHRVVAEHLRHDAVFSRLLDQFRTPTTEQYVRQGHPPWLAADHASPLPAF